MTDILHRLTNGPESRGWTCTTDDEFEIIGEAIRTIETLRYQLAGAQGINRALRHIADQIDLGEER